MMKNLELLIFMAKENKKRLVLLDSHAIIHRAYHALPDFSSTKGEPTGALYGLVTMLIKIMTELEPDYVVACYDVPSPTHRHDVYDGYKATRKKIDDELIAQLIRSKDVFTALGIPVYESKGFEADDVLGTIVEKLKKNKNIEIIIASGDMDTLQLVDGVRVRVYTLRKGISDTVIYDEAMVKERFGFGPELLPDYKGLRGDPSDNIIGVPGIGEKTGTTLIQKYGSVEDIYKKLKVKKIETEDGIKERTLELLKTHEDEAKFSKMLATIRRDAPIEFELPEKSWRETIDLEKVKTLFNELEFRSLHDRLRTVVL
ncbi:MAG TPA: 5'-3' exonuclease H3TH domain-containing protein, partial [Candidatus Nanoarchaeia archaeon]|nr:5'-3' exonuclease H3TH domain-containing protein [Candidatus Nanoarchaeia archaeon]